MPSSGGRLPLACRGLTSAPQIYNIIFEQLGNKNLYFDPNSQDFQTLKLWYVGRFCVYHFCYRWLQVYRTLYNHLCYQSFHVFLDVIMPPFQKLVSFQNIPRVTDLHALLACLNKLHQSCLQSIFEITFHYLVKRTLLDFYNSVVGNTNMELSWTTHTPLSTWIVVAHCTRRPCLTKFPRYLYALHDFR